MINEAITTEIADINDIHGSVPERPPWEVSGNTYTLVSITAYLLGVEKRHFDNVHEPPQLAWYEKLEKDKNARIIRNLCILRTSILWHYSEIVKAMKYDLKNLHSMPEYIPPGSLQQLETDGITIEKANAKPNQYIININKLIADRINLCRSLFPMWIQWDYIRALFIMPNQTTVAGVKSALDEYKRNRMSYPYQVYIRWKTLDNGNILLSDKKFARLLYTENGAMFTDYDKVTDAGAEEKEGIYEFLDDCERCVIVVDCENCDPYKLYATLNNLSKAALLSKIIKIVLYDDVHTSPAWKTLQRFIDIPVEHIVIERLKEQKSLVDMRLATGTCVEHYENNIDSFILCSSDSDYWALISAMPKIRFLVLVEDEKCGPAIKNALLSENIPYCFIDDFCKGNSDDLKVETVLSEVREAIGQAFHLNIQQILSNAYVASRADLTAAEKQHIYDRFIKPMHLVLGQDGEVTIELG